MRMTSWLIVVDVVQATMYFLMSSFVKDLFVFGNLCINICICHSLSMYWFVFGVCETYSTSYILIYRILECNIEFLFCSYNMHPPMNTSVPQEIISVFQHLK